MEIESEISRVISDWDKRAVRYVDDIIVGVDEAESASSIISKLSSALYEYELELNPSKTHLHGLGQPHAPEWIHYIRSFQVSERTTRQREDLDSYFEHAVYLSDRNPQDSVLLFACKRACSFPIDARNAGHLARWMLYCCRRSPACLRFVAEHFAANPPADTTIPDQINSFILQQIPLKAAAGHTEELAWLLFWAREISLKIPACVINHCSEIRSSVVALIALELQDLGCIIGKLDEDFWRTFCNNDGLRSEMWLAAYEATFKEWWCTVRSDEFVKEHEFFSDILERQVSFYDRKRKAEPARLSPFWRLLSSEYTGRSSMLPGF